MCGEIDKVDHVPACMTVQLSVSRSGKQRKQQCRGEGAVLAVPGTVPYSPGRDPGEAEIFLMAATCSVSIKISINQSRYLSCIQISTPDWHNWQQSVLIFYMQVQKGTDRDPACV